MTYYFVVFTKQLVGKEIGRDTKNLFFVLTVFSSLAYGSSLAVFIVISGTKPFLIVHYSMVTVLMLISLSAVYSLFQASRLIKDGSKIRALRMFCALYALIFCWQIVMLFFPVSIIRFSSAFFLLALNAVPIYFLGRFLRDERREAIQSPETQEKMKEFYLKYKLSQREREVVGLILMGKSNDQIKNDLFISVYTVKKHISNIFIKLNVETRTQLYHLVMTDVLMSDRNFGRGL
jgi:DNA-binding CsgD family transcriptional regulator